MPTIRSCAAPAGTYLDSYSRSGAYTDCYTVDVPRGVAQREFVEAFYTTPVFKLERWLIARALSRPSTDDDARRLAAGESDTFAAWSVEQQSPDQVLLAAGRTRSWLMAASAGPGNSATQLYFGSAVVPARRASTDAPRMAWRFRALLGFHRMYSRVLLAAARRKLAR